MGIVGICVLAFIVGAVLLGLGSDVAGPILLFFGAGIAALMLLLIPIQRMSCRDGIAQYYALKDTLTRARAKGASTEFERAAMQKEVADFNKDLASVKYWNSTQFDFWWVDELAELPPLE
jgi:hypothetical protein